MVNTWAFGSEKVHCTRCNGLDPAAIAGDAVKRPDLCLFKNVYIVQAQYPIYHGETTAAPIILDGSPPTTYLDGANSAQAPTVVHPQAAAVTDASPVTKMLKKTKKRALKEVMNRKGSP